MKNNKIFILVCGFLLTNYLFSIDNKLSESEPELGYWICDVIRQEMGVDFVMLPNVDTLSKSNCSLLKTKITISELTKILSDNFAWAQYLPISGFLVNFDSLGNIKIVPSKHQSKFYSIVTFFSLTGIDKLIKTRKYEVSNQTISDCIISFLQKNNMIERPAINRYQLVSITKTEPMPQKTKININTATLDELMTLPGVGPKIGQSIIDYRKENGPFKSKSAIMNVKGIGPKKYEKIKDLITIQ